MHVTLGERRLELGGPYLDELKPANALLGDWDALRARLQEDGFLLIRGFHDRDRVESARKRVLEHLADLGGLDRSGPLEEARIAPGTRGVFLGGKPVTRSREFLDVVEADDVMAFFSHVLDKPALTLDYKWLRAVGHGENTGAHYDIVYMGRGSRNLYTLWTPLGDVSYDMGPLAILSGSSKLDRVRATYGEMDVDRDNVAGFFSSDPVELVEQFGGKWLAAEMRAGDAIVLGMYTMHASLNNESNRFRISSDTRYQPADEPADERWVGENPKAHYAWMKGQTVDMAEARRRWGI